MTLWSAPALQHSILHLLTRPSAVSCWSPSDVISSHLVIWRAVTKHIEKCGIKEPTTSAKIYSCSIYSRFKSYFWANQTDYLNSLKWMLSLLVKYCVHWKCNNNRLKSYKAPLAECSSKNAKLNSKFSRTKPKLIVALKTDNEIIFKNIQNFATQTWQRQCQSRKQTQSQRGSLSAFETPFTLCPSFANIHWRKSLEKESFTVELDPSNLSGKM